MIPLAGAEDNAGLPAQRHRRHAQGQIRLVAAMMGVAMEGFSVHAPEFETGLDWIGTDHPLTLDELGGKFVLLDFWTYG